MIDMGSDTAVDDALNELHTIVPCLEEPIPAQVWGRALWFQAVRLYGARDPRWEAFARSAVRTGADAGDFTHLPSPEPATGVSWRPRGSSTRCWANGVELTDHWFEDGPTIVQCLHHGTWSGLWLVDGGAFPNGLLESTRRVAEIWLDEGTTSSPWLYVSASTASGVYHARSVSGSAASGTQKELAIGDVEPGAWALGGVASLRVWHPEAPWIVVVGSAQAAAWRLEQTPEGEVPGDAAWEGDAALLWRFAVAGHGVFFGAGARVGMRFDDVTWLDGGAPGTIELRDLLRVGADVGLDMELALGRALVLVDVHGWPAFASRGYAIDVDASLGIRLHGPVLAVGGVRWSDRAAGVVGG
ncbi:MAG TPA: hypothetical protein PKA64_12680, partial [Myxococcota bacterium]|nr:hypothetical protein [Myxococcota bacterium]